MNKSTAISLLGGTMKAVADAIGVSSSAVSQWPEELPDRISDRVLAALARKHLAPELIGAESATVSGNDAGQARSPETLGEQPAATETPHAA